MDAIVRERYGPPDVLELREVDRPAPGEGQVLVRVSGSSINPYDWHLVTGLPYLVRLQSGRRGPKDRRVGADLAGRVEAAGPGVADLRPGDEVFGIGAGAFADYAVARASRLAPRPPTMSFDEAAAVPIAGVTALQGLRDKGGLRPGERVLVNGASGGVGTFAVQIAKALGGHVTAVCSTRNVEAARDLGADEAVDYTRDDFTRRGERYDLVLDVAGSRGWSDLVRVLTPQARVVIVGGPKGGPLVGPLGHVIGSRLRSVRSGRSVTSFLAAVERSDLVTLGELIGQGAVRPIVERRVGLAEVPEGLRYLAEGHARGKVVVLV